MSITLFINAFLPVKYFFRMKLVSLVLVLSLLPPAHVYSMSQSPKKAKEVRVVDGVEDSFTHVGLKALVTIMTQDSVVVDTVTCITSSSNGSYVEFYIPNNSGMYLIKAECEGYETKIINYYFDFNKKRIMYVFKNIALKKASLYDSTQAVNLNEVEVRATRLQVWPIGETPSCMMPPHSMCWKEQCSTHL